MDLPCDNSRPNNSVFDGFLPVLVPAFGIVSHLRDVVEKAISADALESHINVEEGTAFLHDHAGIKSWPNLDVVRVKRMSLGGIERLGSDLLELESTHHGVEEDLQEVAVVFVAGLHQLDPLNRNLVLGAFELSLVDWQVGNLLERENIETPIDEEVELFLDLGLDDSQDILADLPRVVRDLGLELAGVLVDTLDVFGLKVNLEVVGVQLEVPALCFGVSCGLLREQLELSLSSEWFHLSVVV